MEGYRLRDNGRLVILAGISCVEWNEDLQETEWYDNCLL